MKLTKESSDEYKKKYNENYDRIMDLKEILEQKNLSVVLWGAGKKGCAFLDVFDPEHSWIDYVVDIDNSKQGKVLNTGHEIKNILTLNENQIIMIANVNWYASICVYLINSSYDVKKMKLLCIDEYLSGKIPLNVIENESIWIRRRYYD